VLERAKDNESEGNKLYMQKSEPEKDMEYPGWSEGQKRASVEQES
jgi:hypothetical protein